MRRRFLAAAAHCSLWVISGQALAQTALGGREKGQNSRDSKTRVLVLGDSLSAEYGLQRGTGWVSLLQERLAREVPGADIINASISGETTSGGRSRLPSLLQRHSPSHVLIELGGNDALRGLPLNSTRENLRAMVQAARNAGARVMLVGMQVPPNYGRAYTEGFAGLFAEVAKAERTALVPFLLKGVADGPLAEQLFQPDRIHPNERAQPRMLENVWPVLVPWLRSGQPG